MYFIDVKLSNNTLNSNRILPVILKLFQNLSSNWKGEFSMVNRTDVYVKTIKMKILRTDVSLSNRKWTRLWLGLKFISFPGIRRLWWVEIDWTAGFLVNSSHPWVMKSYSDSRKWIHYTVLIAFPQCCPHGFHPEIVVAGEWAWLAAWWFVQTPWGWATWDE